MVNILKSYIIDIMLLIIVWDIIDRRLNHSLSSHEWREEIDQHFVFEQRLQKRDRILKNKKPKMIQWTTF